MFKVSVSPSKNFHRPNSCGFNEWRKFHVVRIPIIVNLCDVFGIVINSKKSYILCSLLILTSLSSYDV